MPRLLICGDVLGKFDVLFQRCDTLNKSKAGPFDMILVAGAFFSDDGGGNTESVVEALNSSPLPIYFCDPRGAPAGLLDVPNPANVEWPLSLEAAPSVHWLGSGGVVMVGTLTVAFLSPADTEAGLNKLKTLCDKGVYMGADILLTPEWPAGLASTLPTDGPHTSLASLGVHIDGVGESSAADAAKYSRPRYHFSSTENVFYQRPPYRCSTDAGSAISSNRQSCITRFIGLGTVETGKTVKERKWLHALQLDAIPFMSVEALKEEPAGTTDSPFQLKTSKANQVMGVKEPEAEVSSSERADTGAYFFGADKQGAGKMGGNKRKKRDDGDNEENDTLYLGPIPPGVTGDSLRKQLCSVIPGIDAVLLNVNVPNNKTFGFAQFKSHESAKEAMYALEGLQFVKAKWGKPREEKPSMTSSQLPGSGPPLPPGPPPNKKPNNMEDQEQLATYSNVLFLGFPSPPPVNGTSPEEASSLLTLELQKSLSSALPSLAPALSEKSVKVRAFPGKTYAFLEFPDHDSALSALPSFQGMSLEFSLGEGYGDTIPVTAKWGKPKQEAGPRPARYEADSRVDCWFCLASPTCEAHLVASVANDLYLTLPKGGLCEGHVLAIPVPHGGNHAQLSETGHEELLAYKQALAKCFFTGYSGAGMVVFERYADTRGTYHMHQQIVPVSGNMIGAAKKAFERSGKRQNLDLKEIQSDVDLKEIGDDFYFYVEIWAPGAVAASYPTSRLLHRAKDSKIPVQFGREILAGVLGRPERAFWKACEVGKEAEVEAADAFKHIFSSFDPFSV